MTAPLFATEKHAAQLLDMSAATFRKLVSDGILPGPCAIGSVERWDVEVLQRAVRGELVNMERPRWSSPRNSPTPS